MQKQKKIDEILKLRLKTLIKVKKLYKYCNFFLKNKKKV